MRKKGISFVIALIGLLYTALQAQPTFPVNGVASKQHSTMAFVNATIIKDAQTQVPSTTMIIKEGKILAVGTGITVPPDAMVVDCKGKFIYPSFIDLYADYGMPAPRPAAPFNFFGPSQLTSNQKGAFGWNQALRTDVHAVQLFTVDESKAKSLRDLGFGTVLTHQRDGIARGTGVLVTLASEKENKVVIKEKAAAHFSFNKGSSLQSYPGSMMGMIALLRQTYLDAEWYKSNRAAEGVNITLQQWNEQQGIPHIFEANDKWNDLRADRIGDEFGVQYIIKAGQNEYQRIKEIQTTGASFILPLNFPAAMEVDDPAELRFVGLDDLKHWELAPSNPGAFEKAGIQFCLTTSDLASLSDFSSNLRKSMEYGLTKEKALDALTRVPAQMMGVYDRLGSLDAGKSANFIITSGPLFQDKTVILQNWIQGQKYGVKEENWKEVSGQYRLTMAGREGSVEMSLELKEGGNASFIQKDTLSGKYQFDGKMVKLTLPASKGSKAGDAVMSGVLNGDDWNGTGMDSTGNMFTWSASLLKTTAAISDSAKAAVPPPIGKVIYPFIAFGTEQLPEQETLLIKNTTVWTNESEGVLRGADVLVKGGKIVQIGTGLAVPGARTIDGAGKHLTAGIIDEHSHIAAASINEGGQSVTSEVRIADNLNPDDINIYRQLSGGVTSSHILHGSANTIGGQTQLIKLRWGAGDERLKFEGADPFIKFALGENVKRSSLSSGNNRFPDSRMGVEQVLVDAFTRASDYQKQLNKITEEASKVKKGVALPNPWSLVRRDLELDALVEIMNKKRFITCHSYVQSEINSMMKVAEQFGFRVNTFTHILEGYKVADKMKSHGASASSFSDWWNYKMEVTDAIPSSPAIMHRVGLNVAINSDDAEMARRLNQEAAKSVKYGGMAEEDALKMVTLNPAKMLNVDGRVGSIKIGKDADLVLWSDHPLSIYAKALYTIVDGTVYFDREKDLQLREAMKAERTRLIQKMASAKKSGTAPGGGEQIRRPRPRYELVHTCMDHYHKHGLLEVDELEWQKIQEEK